MATVRTARLVEREAIADGALLRFAMLDGPLGFRGGQYVIVDTGLLLADGKKRKRAYSLSSSDAAQESFELGVYPVAGGLGAAHMLSLSVGDELSFSGPWGKLVPPSAEQRGRVWVIATDTGITAAIGLVRGAGFAPALARTTLGWWSVGPEYFLSCAAVTARLPATLPLREARLPLPASPERPLAVSAHLEALAREGDPSLVYVTGDGHVPLLVRAWLDANGLAAVPLQTENFFHHPVRKSAAREAS